MASNKPDLIVREPEARASVDELTKGLAENARLAGKLPPMREIEDLAQQVTGDTIARHEHTFRNGLPEKVKPNGASPARLDQGAIDDELGTASKIVRPFDAARYAQKAKLVPRHEAEEAILVNDRLRLLMGFGPKQADGTQLERYPEWAERIRKTFTETLALSKNVGLPMKEAESAATDAVLEVLNQSNATFGDWRHPGKSGK